MPIISREPEAKVGKSTGVGVVCRDGDEGRNREKEFFPVLILLLSIYWH